MAHAKPRCSQAQYTDGELTLQGTGSVAHIIAADTMIGVAEYAGEDRGQHGSNMSARL